MKTSINMSASILLSVISFFPCLAQNDSTLRPQISGLIEGWFTADESTVNVAKNTFKIRRARLIADGNKGKIGYKLQLAMEGASPKLFDAFIDYKWKSWLKFRAGQFKYPFSTEGLESAMDLPMLLRAESVNYIANKLGTEGSSFRDIGIQLYGSVGTRHAVSLLQYAVAFVNGSGINTTDNNNSKDFIGKIDVSPIASLKLGASGFFGRAENKGTAIRQEQAYGIYAEFAPPFLSTLTLRGEWLSADYENAEPMTIQTPEGFYLLAAYKIPNEKIPLVFSARWENFDANTTASGYSSDSYTLGITYFISGKNRLRINYIFREAGDLVVGNTHIQETTAKGTGIGNLFLAQAIVGF